METIFQWLLVPAIAIGGYPLAKLWVILVEAVFPSLKECGQ